MFSASPLTRTVTGFAVILIVLFLLAPLAKPQTCNGPGKERWPIKTSLAGTGASNPAKQVRLTDLLALTEPTGVKHDDSRYEDARIPSFSNSLGVKEGDLITTTGWLYLVATESDDCDYHIQISPESRTTTSKPTSGDESLIVEAPRPDFVDDAGLKQQVTTIRDYIKTKIMHGNEPAGSGSVMIHAVCVQVTGQLFYDDAHVGNNGTVEPRGKRGMSSKTLWELHPITSFQIVPSGC